MVSANAETTISAAWLHDSIRWCVCHYSPSRIFLWSYGLTHLSCLSGHVLATEYLTLLEWEFKTCWRIGSTHVQHSEVNYLVWETAIKRANIWQRRWQVCQGRETKERISTLSLIFLQMFVSLWIRNLWIPPRLQSFQLAQHCWQCYWKTRRLVSLSLWRWSTVFSVFNANIFLWLLWTSQTALFMACKRKAICMHIYI